MRVIFALITFFAIFVTNAICEPRLYGIANLGLAKYGKVANEGHPAGFANVTFTNTFGDAYEEIDSLLSTGKVPFQKYDLAWKDNHVFKKSDFPAIVQEAKKYAVLAEKYKSVECAFSGATEHTLNKKDATDLANLVLAVIPERCVYVNNPWVGKGAFINPSERIWNETHGADAKPPNIGGKHIFNFDGSDAFDYHVEKIKKRFPNAEVFFFWTSQNNGRKNKNDQTPRPQRKAWPTPELLQAEGFLATNKGRVRLPDKGDTVKPKADQHNVPPESRALKPVFLLKRKTDRISLKVGKKTIITSGKGEPFVDGRTRYYFNEYGYQIVKRAGQSVLDIYDDRTKKKIGKGNPGFRE